MSFCILNGNFRLENLIMSQSMCNILLIPHPVPFLIVCFSLWVFVLLSEFPWTSFPSPLYHPRPILISHPSAYILNANWSISPAYFTTRLNLKYFCYAFLYCFFLTPLSNRHTSYTLHPNFLTFFKTFSNFLNLILTFFSFSDRDGNVFSLTAKGLILDCLWRGCLTVWRTLTLSRPLRTRIMFNRCQNGSSRYGNFGVIATRSTKCSYPTVARGTGKCLKSSFYTALILSPFCSAFRFHTKCSHLRQYHYTVISFLGALFFVWS